MASAVGVPFPAGRERGDGAVHLGSVHRGDLDVDGAGDAAGAVVHRIGVRLGERLHPPGDRALRGADHRLQRRDDDLPLGRRAARRRAVGDVDHRARPIEHHQDVRRLGGRLELQEAAVRVSGVADPDVTAAAGRADAAAGSRHDAAARATAAEAAAAAARATDGRAASPFARDALHRFGSCASPEEARAGRAASNGISAQNFFIETSHGAAPAPPGNQRGPADS